MPSVAGRAGGSRRSDCIHIADCGQYSEYHCRMYCRDKDDEEKPYPCKYNKQNPNQRTGEVNMAGYKKGGLKKKYIITKVNGRRVDPEAEYFVLRLDKDPHARKAALAYAESVKEDNPKFADDIERRIMKLDYYRKIGRILHPEDYRGLNPTLQDDLKNVKSNKLALLSAMLGKSKQKQVHKWRCSKGRTYVCDKCGKKAITLPTQSTATTPRIAVENVPDVICPYPDPITAKLLGCKEEHVLPILAWQVRDKMVEMGLIIKWWDIMKRVSIDSETPSSWIDAGLTVFKEQK